MRLCESPLGYRLRAPIQRGPCRRSAHSFPASPLDRGLHAHGPYRRRSSLASRTAPSGRVAEDRAASNPVHMRASLRARTPPRWHRSALVHGRASVPVADALDLPDHGCRPFLRSPRGSYHPPGWCGARPRPSPAPQARAALATHPRWPRSIGGRHPSGGTRPKPGWSNRLTTLRKNIPGVAAQRGTCGWPHAAPWTLRLASDLTWTRREGFRGSKAQSRACAGDRARGVAAVRTVLTQCTTAMALSTNNHAAPVRSLC